MTTSPTSTPLYNWLRERSAGILCHITSLPSETGIGNLGHWAYRWVDFLAAARMGIWQICPLGPTGYGDSPYQSFSAFAGNPYLIDWQPLLDEGLITEREIEPLRRLPWDRVDYGRLYELVWPLLHKAHQRFKESGASALRDCGTIRDFREEHSFWLRDFSLFLALKAHFGGKPWTEWPPEFRDYNKMKRENIPAEVEENAAAHVFYQYVFFHQLARLRAYARERGIDIMGDLPIFVAYDSADAWANRELFQLNKDGSPKAVAGVPPDYFAADGQLWGNPLYDWKAHKKDGFSWWIERVRSNLGFYDILRLDHFRGFHAYWSVPGNAKTAREGKWVESPGMELFSALRSACPEAKLVAEDLGLITEEVDTFRKKTGLPGMAVLQFAFGGDAGNPYLPHNYARNTVAYTGTHDNDTSRSWYAGLDEGTRDHIRRYLSVSGDEIPWDLIRAAIRSTAHMAIFPLQDLFAFGNEARLNTPGVAEGNWQWRFLPEQLDQLEHDSAPYLEEILRLYGRCSEAENAAPGR